MTIPPRVKNAYQKVKWPLTFLVIGVLVVWFVTSVLYDLKWTGLGGRAIDSNYQHSKTLWDWLDLLIIPLMLAFGGWFINRSIRQAEWRQEIDKQREQALQNYYGRMSELLLKENLSEDSPDKVKAVARTITLATLQQLDPDRKRQVVKFLYETLLIGWLEFVTTTSFEEEAGMESHTSARRHKSIMRLREANMAGVNLAGVNLAGANLAGVNLAGANLHGAFLMDAHLHGANLATTNLQGAKLEDAKLVNAELMGAKLVGANLRGANLHGAKLEDAKFDKTTILPDDTHWIRNTDMHRFTDPKHPGFRWYPIGD